MKKVLCAFVLVGALLSAKAASAEYICNATWTPGAAAWGNYGYIGYDSYELPDCGGQYWGYRIICSAGANQPYCTNYSYQLPADSVQMVGVWAGIREAAEWNALVQTFTGPCIGGGSGCAYTVLYK